MPAQVEIDKRKLSVEERIAHVEDVGIPEVNDRVAIGVRVLDVEDVNLVAVPVERDLVGERYLGKCTRR